MSDPVVVFGASSYVGGHAIQALLASGHRVIGVARRPQMARMLLPQESAQFSVATAGQVADLIGHNQCSIVNFAYVKDLDPGRMYWQNRALMDSIAAVAAGRCRRLVHISTAAVFGFRFSEPPTAERVGRPPDDPYGESKIHSERLAEQLATRSSAELAIVRLGNVIGPGSPAWAAGIAQRLLEVKPVGYTGANGYSNATHVENIGDYIETLVTRREGELAAHGVYHHLAEFSGRRWPELLNVISAEVGHPWTTVARPSEPAAKGGPVKRALKAGNRSAAGRYMRAGLGRIPDERLLDRLNRWIRYVPPPHLAAIDAIGGDDVGLLEVFSSEHEFRSRTVAGWAPNVDFDQACDGIARWVASSGFTIKPESAP